MSRDLDEYEEKNTKATWSFSLDTECPNCKIALNLDDMNYYSYVSDLKLYICEQDTENSRNIEVHCHHCEHEFLVDCQY